MDNSNVSYPTTRQKNSTTKIVTILFIVILLLIGGVFMYSNSQKIDNTAVPTPTITEKKEPTPTEKPTIDKTSIKIQVLNGTGTPGQAVKTVEALTKTGYNADLIKTGNASDDLTVTTIRIQDGYDDIADDIKKTLSELYDSVEIDTSKLEDASEFNIIVTTGGKKYEEPTKTATSSPSIIPTSTPSLTISPTTALTVSPSPSATFTPTPTP